MPEKKTIKKSQKLKKEGKAPTTQAGPFVEEEIRHIRQGKHGAKNTEQAIAIGLSEARASGVDVPKRLGKKASRSGKKRIVKKKVSSKRSQAAKKRLSILPNKAASKKALSLHGKKTAKKKSAKK